MSKKKTIETIPNITSLKHRTEWAGYYLDKNNKTIKLQAKSFNLNKKDEGDYFKDFINSIVYLYSTDAEKKLEKNIKFIEGKINIDNVDFSEVMILILFFQLKELHELLLVESFFFYNAETKNIPTVKGRINFAKSIQANHGLMHKQVCTYRKVSFDHPLLSLIRQFYAFFPAKIYDSGSAKDLASELTLISSNVESMFSESRPLNSYVNECVKVCSSGYDNDYRFSRLMKNVKYLAQFYLDNSLFFSSNENENLPQSNGLVFNLNRPFEIVLQRSMRYVFGDSENIFPKIENFTHTRYIDNEIEGVRLDEIKYMGEYNSNNELVSAKNIWLPDCWFKLGERVVILDAKHKVLSKKNVFTEEDEDEEDNENVNDENVKKGKDYKIDRTDLFQLITYMSMHPDRVNKTTNIEENNVYSLIALNEEDEFTDKHSEYVLDDAPVVVKFFSGSENKFYNVAPENKIKIVPVRFGQFLLDLGLRLKPNDYNQPNSDDFEKGCEEVFINFGLQIAKKLGIDKYVKEELQNYFFRDLNQLLSDVGHFERFYSFKQIEKEFLKVKIEINVDNKVLLLKVLQESISSNFFPIKIETWKKEGLEKVMKDDLFIKFKELIKTREDLKKTS
ncbi:MAG: hypothetical protein Q7U04_02875 [Bacteriovorax sp.]|nr:hypothetical protein [Bacteriovorax sp.]